MRVDEAKRHDVYKGLEEVLGAGRAAALMNMLPGDDWDEIATKRDIRESELRLRTHIAETVNRQTKWLAGVVSALMLAMIGSTAALVQAILSRVPVLPAG